MLESRILFKPLSQMLAPGKEQQVTQVSDTRTGNKGHAIQMRIPFPHINDQLVQSKALSFVDGDSPGQLQRELQP